MPLPEGDIEVGDDVVIAGTLEDFPDDGWGRLVELGGRGVAVFRDGDTVRAVDRTCPHAGGPLDEGMLVDGGVLCPLHSYTFDLSTGQCREDPSLQVDCFPVQVIGGNVAIARRPRRRERPQHERNPWRSP